MIVKPYIYAIVAVVLLVGGFTAGIRWERGADAIADQRLQRAEDKMALVAAHAIAGIKITNKTIQAKTIHETETNTIYGDCKLPASGLQLANEALTGPSTGNSKLPGASTNGGPINGQPAQ